MSWEDDVRHLKAEVIVRALRARFSSEGVDVGVIDKLLRGGASMEAVYQHFWQLRGPVGASRAGWAMSVFARIWAVLKDKMWR
jgi:hypothetical protein